jgi:hypothetical protein
VELAALEAETALAEETLEHSRVVFAALNAETSKMWETVGRLRDMAQLLMSDISPLPNENVEPPSPVSVDYSDD